MHEPHSVETVTVTPAIAHDWLGYNTHNRRVRDRVVDAYAADMAAGNWQWNGESIKFAAGGALLDGQHRLTAIVSSGMSVPMLVVRGLPATTQDTVDGGTKRKFSDVLQLRGEINYTTLASLIRRVALWESGIRRPRSVVPTNAQLLQTLEKHPELRDAAQVGTHTAMGCGLPPSLCSFGYWLFAQIDEGDAGFFFDRLHDGQNLIKGDPIYELRKAVEASKTVRGERSTTFLNAILIKAWNAYRDGGTVAFFAFRTGGANPERFPEPR